MGVTATTTLHQDTGQVEGMRCGKDHFNDPAATYCAVCGLSMLSARRTALGTRPQLGTLVLGNGTVVPVVRDLVLGRAAERDADVLAGRAGAVRLVDPFASEVHARVVLDGWTVALVDAGSAHGTFVCPPGAGAWTRLEPGAAAELVPGTAMAMGRCVLTYHSHRR